MKKIFILLLMTIAGLIFAQSTNIFSPSYSSSVWQQPSDGKIPPLLTLDAAYGKAVLSFGAATNQFHCVSATCLNRLRGYGGPDGMCDSGWTFVFSDTNGVRKNVYVYFNTMSTVWVEKSLDSGW